MDLKNRKGKIIFNREFLLNANQSVLEAIFSNFYPIAVQDNHDFNMYGRLDFFGLSSHFDESEEGFKIPTYDLVIEIDKNDKVKNIEFKKVNEKKQNTHRN